MDSFAIIILVAVALVVAAIITAICLIAKGKKDPEAVMKFIQWIARVFVKSAEQQFKDETYIVEGEVVTKGEKKFNYVAEKVFRLLDKIGIYILEPDMINDFIESEVFELPKELETIDDVYVNGTGEIPNDLKP